MTDQTKSKSLYFISIALFILLTLWWVAIYLGGTTDAWVNNAFGFVYGGFSLWGGLWGFVTAQLWGGKKSLMGKAMLCLSWGLLLQGFGQYSFWFYNIFLHIDVPYPGVPDIGFFGTIPFYIVGAWLLTKASGATISLRLFKNRIPAVLIPGLMLLFSYFFILKNTAVDLSAPMKTLLDFGYPLGQAIYTSLAILTYSLSRKMLGGVMRGPIFMLVIAFVLQFFADYLFIYFHNIFYPASVFDYLYLVAYFAMTIGILRQRSVILGLRKSSMRKM